MKVNFETERLMIRPLVPGDAEAAFRWCGDPKVNTYMIYPLYHKVEDVRAWLESRDVGTGIPAGAVSSADSFRASGI